MNNKPSLQWYPGDVRRDVELRMCSIAARGLWYELLWIMHDGDPVGSLGVKGGLIPPDQLARLTGVTVEEFHRLLSELERVGVFSRRESDGLIYSRRMVRDNEAREAARIAGQKGGNPMLIRRAPDLFGSVPLRSSAPDTLNPPLNPPLKMKMKVKVKSEGEGGRMGDRGKPGVDPVLNHSSGRFSTWWTCYGKDVGCDDAWTVWQQLNEDEQRACVAVVERYAAARAVGFRKDPVNYLLAKAWRDAIVTPQAKGTAPPKFPDYWSAEKAARMDGPTLTEYRRHLKAIGLVPKLARTGEVLDYVPKLAVA